MLSLDRLHSAVLRFREVMRATEIRAIDTGKNSEVMRALTSAVHALSWRSGAAGEACHWADGYPLNVLLYCSLLQTIFDLRERTVVLDEVGTLVIEGSDVTVSVQDVDTVRLAGDRNTVHHAGQAPAVDDLGHDNTVTAAE